MGPKYRIKQYALYKGISYNQITQTAGLANGYLNGNGHINSDSLMKIWEHYPDLNLYWVLTGRGYMISLHKGEPNFEYPVAHDEDIIKTLKKYQKDYPELGLLIEIIEFYIQSEKNTNLALVVSAKSKDEFIMKLENDLIETKNKGKKYRNEIHKLTIENDHLRKELSQLTNKLISK